MITFITGSIFAIETTNLMDFVPVEKVHTAQAMTMMMFSISTFIGAPFVGNLCAYIIITSWMFHII
jgi:predicted MFS family arabinose efflux permease